ncbi:MAG: endolytic transglycosylase MltG [Candidatus Pacebacteria bacterium]|nr:endolytic transglycosylase MltG [Candidatus Paceibacterota bacterium]
MIEFAKKYKLIIFSCLGVLIIVSVFVFFFTKKPIVKKTTPIAIVTTPTAPVVTTTKPNTPVTTTSVKPVPPPPPPVGTDRFIVSLTDTPDTISANLLSGGYIADATAFSNLIGTKIISPGGYKISQGWTTAQMLQVLSGKPYMKWVLIPPGLRKEEIAALLASTLGWTKKQTTYFITKDTTTKPEYVEGVYAPDTYLIPVAETTTQVTTRLINQFNQNFSPYLPQFTAKDVKWTSALTLASIVQREAANAADMPLIAGILWNRLNQGMQLDVDSTLQYARGNTGSGWWAPITVADKKIDSPYNTYIHTGLPPHPISNPSIDAISAVLNPATTDCIYYLHDNNHITHCSVTYAEQEANVQKYLITPPTTN